MTAAQALRIKREAEDQARARLIQLKAQGDLAKALSELPEALRADYLCHGLDAYADALAARSGPIAACTRLRAKDGKLSASIPSARELKRRAAERALAGAR